MNNNFFSKFGLIFLIQIVFFSSCKKAKVNHRIDSEFTKYISSFSSGTLSNKSTILINLREPLEENKLKVKASDLLKISPSVEGEAVWVDNQSIAFKPSELMESGKEYQVQFKLSKLIEVEDKLKTLNFGFKTYNQKISVKLLKMLSYSENDFSKVKIVGELLTSDFAENENVEETLEASQEGNKLNISWTHNADKRHYFEIEKVKRIEKNSKVIVTWDGKTIASNTRGEASYTVPSILNFSVQDIKVQQGQNQFATINFSEPLSKNQELDGLIYLESNHKLRFEKDGLSVRVYPTKKLAGTHKLIISNLIKNKKGKSLHKQYKKALQFTSKNPEIKKIAEGNILPTSSEGLIYPFRAVNLSAVDVRIIRIYGNNVHQFFQSNQLDGTNHLKRVGRIEYHKEHSLKEIANKEVDLTAWNNFSLDLSKLIKVDPGAIYRIAISYKRRHSLYPCSEAYEEDEQTKQREEEARVKEDKEYDYDSSSYYYDDYDYEDYYEEGYDWDDRDNPCKSSYYMRSRRFIEHNVFASDLGIIAKSGKDNKLFVAVTSLKTTEPIAGAKLKVYNFQGQLMKEGISDADGMTDLNLNKKPFLLVVEQAEQFAYLRLNDGASLSLSMFDVGGQKNEKGLKGFIYGERGVWRPGDQIYLNFILEDKNNVIPEDYPIIMELYTPEHQLYKRIVKKEGLNNLYNFTTETENDSPTGNWTAKVKVGNNTYSKRIKIEAIKPNRLKVELNFDEEIIKTHNAEAELKAKWLHGATAKNLKADVELSISSGKTNFEDFEGYVFDDPSKTYNTKDSKIFDGKLDEEGTAKVITKIGRNYKHAPGFLKANYKIRVFEKGGEFSVGYKTATFSPYVSYVGLKVPKGDGWNGALYSDQESLFSIATIDENNRPVDRKKVRVEVYKVDWRWWWDHGDEDYLGRYVSNNSRYLVKTEHVNTEDGKAIYSLKFDEPKWGRFFIKVTDPISGHSSGSTVYMTYSSWYSSSDGNNPGGAEMLSFTTDKKKYKVGENVQVQIPSTNTGKVLLTVESGAKIHLKKWVDISSSRDKINFTVTPEMTPNVYVHLMLIQPHEHENDLPIRLYGIQPIFVSDDETILKPVIETSESLEPESSYEVKIHEENDKAMTYTLAVVDEGLLDLTNFKTPSPHKNFYIREALGVKTWDMYKYVMNAFTGELAGLIAIGGDEFSKSEEGKKAERFKPVVNVIGPFYLEAGETATHNLEMPNYVGSVKMMLISAQDGAYGNTEKVVPVKKPLMVLGTLPRTLSPKESVKLPVTVFAMEESVKDVQIEIETNDKIKIIGEERKSLHFDEIGDQVIEFDLQVAKNLGLGRVYIRATSNGNTAKYEFELDVKAPNPLVSKTFNTVLEAGKSWSQDFELYGYKNTNEATLELSYLPSMNLEKRLEYLVSYPHGCVEQTTSSVFPQLYLEDLMNLSIEKKMEVEKNVRAAINRLGRFQLSSGGLGYWPSSSYESEWGTSYAGNFILEAKNKGYAIPDNFLNSWIAYQTKVANNWKGSFREKYYVESEQLKQAYRLYTLALARNPATAAMNRLKSEKKLSSLAKWRLANAYALIGKKDIAKEMIWQLNLEVKTYKNNPYTYGSDVRDQAMILETLTLLEDKRALAVLKDICKELQRSRWMSTQTTAYALTAVAKYAGDQSSDEPLDVAYTLNSQSQEAFQEDVRMKNEILKLADKQNQHVIVKNNSSKKLFVTLTQKGIPLDSEVTTESNGLDLKVNYLDLNGSPINVKSLKQGEDFMVEVEIHHSGVRSDYKDLVLNQIFPSGWEIRNMRMDLTESQLTKGTDKPTYQDIRDDRVFTYFDLKQNQTKVFRILLNASYKGKFFYPSILCEAMYDAEINAKKAGYWIEITE